jgi:hypothetical protein
MLNKLGTTLLELCTTYVLLEVLAWPLSWGWFMSYENILVMHCCYSLDVEYLPKAHDQRAWAPALL